MVSSSNEGLPSNNNNADLPDGGELARQYLNDDALSENHPNSSPMHSSRGMTPSSDGQPKNSSSTSQNGTYSSNTKNEGDSRGTSEGPGRHRSSRAGARSVSKLTPEQLKRKRANDREAQRAIRQRTKEHIESLEREIQELRSERRQAPWEVEQRNRELEETVVILKQQLEDLRIRNAALSGQPLVPMGMTTDGQDMSWQMPMSMPYDTDAMNSFDPNQPMGVSSTGDLTGTGTDLMPAYTNQAQGLITPYPSESPTAGNFPDMDTSALNYGPLPGQDDLIGLPDDLATPTWTNAVDSSFQMGDPNMFSPPTRYLNSQDAPFPYNTHPVPSIPTQPSRPQQQQQPAPSIQPIPSDPENNVKYELSATSMPNPPQQVQTPQPTRQAQSSLPTPPDNELQNRRQQQQQQQQQHQQQLEQRSQQQATQQTQRSLQPVLKPKPQPNHPQYQQQPQQQRQLPLSSQVGGIPIAPAPPPPAHLQRSQPSSQNLPPVQQEQQLLQQRRLQQQQQYQPQQQQTLPRRTSPRSSQQMQQNMSLQSSPQPPPQESLQYCNQIPTFLPPVNMIDNILHSALAQHRQSIQNGGPNPRAPDYSGLLSVKSTTGSNPLLSTGSNVSPLSAAISRAIQVAGFKGIATQAAVLYTTHCLLRWQADPTPETYTAIPKWLRPGNMQLRYPHALWVSQLVWQGLREWVAGQGGRYAKDEFILCYARNLKLDWQKGQERSLTGGTSMGPGFTDGIFEMNSNGEIVTTGKFEATVRDQSNWGLRGEFFKQYPELVDMVSRASD